MDTAPTPATDRLPLLDALRGMAVLGILVANIQEFSMPHAGFFYPISYGDSTGLNFLIWHVSNSFFNGRFFSILMMVFGASMVLGSKNGSRWSGINFRRMVVLGCVGLLHGWLIWDGDILFVMALAGLFVFPMHQVKARHLVFVALLVGLGGPLVMVALGAADALAPLTESANFDSTWNPNPADTQKQIEQFLGPWPNQQALRITRNVEFYSFVIPVYLIWRVASLAMLGMVFMRNGFFSGKFSDSQYKIIMVFAIVAGLPLSLTVVQNSLMPEASPRFLFPIALAYEFCVVTLMATGWVSALVLFSRARLSLWFVQSLGAVGRMSLSNYIGQSIICTTLFYGFGFGLFGRLERTDQILLVISIWIFQICISVWWLNRFKFGPLEWLWRTLVYH